jgi:hypothetical protein
VWITEDIRNAFDHVPHNRLMDIVCHLLPDEGTQELVRQIISNRRGRGLRQGGSLSPLLLNAYLHHLLDRPWRRLWPNAPLVRVADDLLVLCRTRSEAEQAYPDLRQRLQAAGLPLKGTLPSAVHDLTAGDTALWLGFVLGRQGHDLCCSLAESSWSRLQERLSRAHTGPNTPQTMLETIRGWVSSRGPCYATTNMARAHARIAQLAREFALEEVPSLLEVTTWWCEAHRRYQYLRETRPRCCC